MDIDKNTPDVSRINEIRQNIEKQGWFNHNLVTTDALGNNEQYRFHFDATKCIGCKCCVVACKEQNNNPSAVTWRRVGELEAGEYPNTKRVYLSIGCNHCLEPACMAGCPTDSYHKDENTGIVRHNDDSCIGCQYCVWNCPYGVPQFNQERGIVTKCDMCYPRITNGQIPACVESCPQGAIQIEKVNQTKWRKNHELADSPGMPDSEQTLSTTKITLPNGFRKQAKRVNSYHVEPEHSNFSLILFLALSQMSVGAFFIFQLLKFFQKFWNNLNIVKPVDNLASVSVFFIAMLSLSVAVFHLGRPFFAYRAVKMWHRSWLSREALFLGLFAFFCAAYAVLLYDLGSENFNIPGFLISMDTTKNTLPSIGALAMITGLIGIYSSARLYILPSRPAWNSSLTIVHFSLTAILMGTLFAQSIIVVFSIMHEELASSSEISTFLMILSAIAISVSLIKIVTQVVSFFTIFSDEGREKYSTFYLLVHMYRKSFLLRLGFLLVGGIIFPIISLVFFLSNEVSPAATMFTLAGFILVLANEIIERYHFFVTVVPKNMAGNFFD